MNEPQMIMLMPLVGVLVVVLAALFYLTLNYATTGHFTSAGAKRAERRAKQIREREIVLQRRKTELKMIRKRAEEAAAHARQMAELQRQQELAARSKQIEDVRRADAATGHKRTSLFK